MTYDQALQRLRHHSNLPDTTSGTPCLDESFILALSEARDGALPPPVGSLCDDVVTCIEVLERGGSVGEEPAARRPISVEAAYAVSGILCQGLYYLRQWGTRQMFDPSVHAILEHSLYRIAYAWDQLLARYQPGDVLHDSPAGSL